LSAVIVSGFAATHLYQVITFLIILGIVAGVIIVWLLLAPVIIEADSRVPNFSLRWWGVGHADIFYDGEWTVKWKLFFFGKTMKLQPRREKRTKKKIAKPRRRKMKAGRMLKMAIRIIRSFRVHHWQWVLDTGDNTLNAKLYPVNYLPGCYGHMQVNFTGINYLCFRISNRPWRVLLVLLKR
jgi:hypothetical protein